MTKEQMDVLIHSGETAVNKYFSVNAQEREEYADAGGYGANEGGGY